MRFFVMLSIAASLYGCIYDSTLMNSVDRVVTGTVFKDCEGSVLKNKTVYLQYSSRGCFSGGVISQDSTVTDEFGRFNFNYREYEQPASTTRYFYTLTIPNSTINIYCPDGNYELYPNQKKMNAIIDLKFRDACTTFDTFYFEFVPTYDGRNHEPELSQFLVGPFHDTTIVLNNLIVGNVNSQDNGRDRSGTFKWGIDGNRSRHFTRRVGSLVLTHQPCVQADTFVYFVEPM